MSTATHPDTVQKGSGAEHILLAARDLEAKGVSPFHLETLVLAAWKRAPVAFGLRGYAEEHPDSNRVLCAIVGRRRLLERGLLERVGPKLYRLTTTGRQLLAPQAANGTPRPVTDGVGALVLILEATAAAEKHRAGRKDTLTFGDASQFWGIADDDCGDRIDRRLSRVAHELEKARCATDTGDLILEGGRLLTAEDVERVLQVSDYLAARFAKHLSVLRNRN